MPQDQVEKSREETIEAEIDDILSSIKSDEITEDGLSESENTSTEDFVIDQIKN